jgi:hypothetical protein
MRRLVSIQVCQRTVMVAGRNELVEEVVNLKRLGNR